MKPSLAWPFVAVVMLGAAALSFAGDLKDQIKIETENAQLHAGMDPGQYICAAGHLHIKGTVENVGQAPVGTVKVAGKVLDADGKVIGTATASTKQPVLNPHDKAPINLEFLSVTGEKIKQVKNQELSVVAVAPKP